MLLHGRPFAHTFYDVTLTRHRHTYTQTIRFPVFAVIFKRVIYMQILSKQQQQQRKKKYFQSLDVGSSRSNRKTLMNLKRKLECVKL